MLNGGLGRTIFERRHLLTDRRAVLGLAVAVILLLLVIRLGSGPPETRVEGEEPMRGLDLTAIEREEPIRGGSLRVAMPGELFTLDPHRAATPSERMVVSALTDPLFFPDPGGGVRSDLLADWQVDEDAAGYTLILRPDIQFSDGSPLDARAVQYNLHRMQEIGSPVMRGAWLASIREMEVVDELELRIELSYPDPHLPLNLSRPETGLVSPRAVEGSEEAFSFAPVGLGPFTVRSDTRPEEGYVGESSERDAPEVLSEVTLRHFEDYWRGRPRLDALVFVRAREGAEPEQLLREGFDLVAQTPPGYSVPRDLGSALVRPNLDYHLLALNLDRGPLRGAEVRRALHHALDRERLIQRFYSDDADVLLIGGYPNRPDEHAEDEPDPQRAEYLLRASGFGEEDDPLSLTMLSNQDEHRMAVSRAIGDQLAKFGIEVELESVPDDEYYERMRAGEYDISYWILLPDLTDPLGYTGNLRSDAYWNVSQLWRRDDLREMQQQIDELLIEAARTPDEEEQLALYREFAELTAREQLYLSLWTTGTRAIAADNVREIRAPHGFSFCFWRTWLAPEE